VQLQIFSQRLLRHVGISFSHDDAIFGLSLELRIWYEASKARAFTAPANFSFSSCAPTINFHDGADREIICLGFLLIVDG